MLFHIVVPAWGARCTETATSFVIPSLKAALADSGANARIIAYTDDRAALESALAGCNFEIRRVAAADQSPGGTFLELHRWTMAEAPVGSIVTLLNADIVVSREFFAVAQRAFIGNDRLKVIAACAMRTALGGEPPPIGVTARALTGWAWRNRHPITTECIWGSGRTTFPNTVIFARGDDVVLHSVHLHPFFLRAEERRPVFNGTIDDDLLGSFADDEVRFLADAEIGFAELSPVPFKPNQYGVGVDLSTDAVIRFGGRMCNWSPAHWRNLAQPLRISGRGDPGGKAEIETIITALKARRVLRPVRSAGPVSTAEMARIARARRRAMTNA